MGRAKLNMELISKEKTRNITYQKRKSGLLKKAYEFTTLCDVSACLIIYGPNSREPEIWPSNPDEVKRVIAIYKDKRSECAKRTFALSDFFEDRKKKIEDELAKARRRNMEAKYPTWFDFLNNLNEVQLREFANVLDNKLDVLKNKIDILKGNTEFFSLGLENMNNEYFLGRLPLGLENKNRVELANGNNDYFQGLPLGLGQSGLDLENKIDDHFNVPVYPPADQGHLTCPINPSPMMMVMMSDNDYGNFNGASCSNVQYAPFNRDLCYDAVCGMIESSHHVVYNNPNPNPMPLMRYYAPPTTLQPLPSPFMQCTLMSSVSSQVKRYDDVVDANADADADYQMNNKRKV